MNLDELDWEKSNGLLPAIVQDAEDGRVLMLGYMNREALEATRATKRVTFHSRSRDRLWTKGETSGNFLELVEVVADCDRDALLVRATPSGPVCHRGTPTCFDSEDPVATSVAFLGVLDRLVLGRQLAPKESSYTSQLFAGGVSRAAQKVGEEAVEVVIAALNESDDAVLDEASDLVYHLIVTLRTRGLGLADVAQRLRKRHRERHSA